MTSSAEPLRVVRRRSAVAHEAPTAAAVEGERKMWDPHPDKALGKIEEAFYQAGHQFLMGLYHAALGKEAPRELRKALTEGPVRGVVPPHDFGALVDLYGNGGSPLEQRDEWSRMIDRLVEALFPQRTQEETANAVAIHAHWLGRIRTRTEERGTVPRPETWHQAEGVMSPRELMAMEWTKARALEGCHGLAEDAADGLRNVLIQSKQAGEGTGQLARRCFDTFGDLNRDWRRLALTETAAAHANGQLAAADPSQKWVAEWVSAHGSCEWCAQWNGRIFKVVDPGSPKKDPATEVWVGKTNIGRKGARKTKAGVTRPASEVWQPCIPCHPNCSCVMVIRKVA